ncbi:hypothetical protein H3H37_24510 [Duganella sp. LX20W]|uniref:Uncharacterized protein n=1 Tax=Rugamonas brunnea TaxID=2758569 RepID=A0A7W2EX52_9BURK|nr:hypothetical protein [Rugamonas brunnea]MBA5640232.1 hypothetical protein [Rugamonas brunnea]
MKTIPLAALPCALVLALTAHAQTPDTVRIPASAPHFTLPDHPYRLSEADLYTYKGAYDLSNGKSLYLFTRGYTLYAEVDNEGRHRLVPASDHTFVAADRQLKLELDAHDDGTINGTLTMVVPATQIGGVAKDATLVVATLR